MNLENKNIIIISGPTASGKSAQTIELYKSFLDDGINSEIVNFDSLLFYNELNIGTAKPTKEELEQYPHRLVNISSAKNHINASDYKNIAMPLIKKLHDDKKVVILVGGSGFYVRALIKGMYDSPTTSEEVRNKVSGLLVSEGIEVLRDVLKTNDFESYENLHVNDEYRIVRAVEHFYSTGKALSIEKKKMEENDPYDLTRGINIDWNIIHFHLDLAKVDHLAIIEKRAKDMFEAGLLDEVSNLLRSGFTGDEKPLKSIGYKEAVSFIKGEDIKSLEDCIERVIISTRQLAKAQRTWFKRSLTKNDICATSHDILSQIRNTLF